MMNRRGFLQLLGMSAAGLAVGGLELDPERALWVPGAKTFFLPPEPEYRSGSNQSEWVFDRWVTEEALKILQAKLDFAGVINRTYDDPFLTPGGRITLSVPIRYTTIG